MTFHSHPFCHSMAISVGHYPDGIFIIAQKNLKVKAFSKFSVTGNITQQEAVMFPDLQGSRPLYLVGGSRLIRADFGTQAKTGAPEALCLPQRALRDAPQAPFPYGGTAGTSPGL